MIKHIDWFTWRSRPWAIWNLMFPVLRSTQIHNRSTWTCIHLHNTAAVNRTSESRRYTSKTQNSENQERNVIENLNNQNSSLLQCFIIHANSSYSAMTGFLKYTTKAFLSIPPQRCGSEKHKYVASKNTRFSKYQMFPWTWGYSPQIPFAN